MERTYRGYLRPREYFITRQGVGKERDNGLVWNSGYGGKRKGRAHGEVGRT